MPGLTTGPKIVNVDRVEWITMPEAGTAVTALQTGEIDWWEVPSPDLLPLLRQDRKLMTVVKDMTGVLPILRFNALQKPFDNQAVRRAALVRRPTASCSWKRSATIRSQWRDRVGLFTPGTPMATDAPGWTVSTGKAGSRRGEKARHRRIRVSRVNASS